MTFKELFPSFTKGLPIKRKIWGGYWKMENNLITIYTKEGEVIPLSEALDHHFTLGHTLEDDWEIATDENCDIPVI